MELCKISIGKKEKEEKSSIQKKINDSSYLCA
jgi:hypothetical protein